MVAVVVAVVVAAEGNETRKIVFFIHIAQTNSCLRLRLVGVTGGNMSDSSTRISRKMSDPVDESRILLVVAVVDVAVVTAAGAGAALVVTDATILVACSGNSGVGGGGGGGGGVGGVGGDCSARARASIAALHS